MKRSLFFCVNEDHSELLNHEFEYIRKIMVWSVGNNNSTSGRSSNSENKLGTVRTISKCILPFASIEKRWVIVALLLCNRLFFFFHITSHTTN